MERRKTILTSLLAGLGIVVLVLDSKTAVQATADAAQLCIQVVIPSLFPLFVFSILLTGSLDGQNLSFLRPIGRLCGIPDKSEALLLTGFLGGYPTGAQCVAQAYSAGTLGRDDAVRILPVCSNAGPAFIFGITGTLFSNTAVPWVLWVIQMLSALFLGWIFAPEKSAQAHTVRSGAVTITEALQKSVRAISGVCGWILLFRCFIAFLQKWFLRLLPVTAQAVFIGCLELTNGCWFLREIDSEGIRFVLCSAFLSFGGICVLMQTLAVTGDLGLRAYLPGKLLQALISIGFSVSILPFLFDSSRLTKQLSIISCSAAVLIIFCLKHARKIKKTVAFKRIRVYNEQKS